MTKANTLQNMVIDNIPGELRRLPQWIGWLSVPGNGAAVKLPGGRSTKKLDARAKPHKLPISPHSGNLASATRRSDWAPFDAAMQAAARWSLSGIGFVFTSSDPHVGIDLDKCRDPETGQIADWAVEIIRELNSYTEISPSGTGAHTICRASQIDPKGMRAMVSGGEIEIYSQGRYFTFTGKVVDGAPVGIRDCSNEILVLQQRLSKTRNRAKTDRGSPQIVSASDEKLISQAIAAKNGDRFRRLWEGNWQADYPSQSEADLALCNHLAFWTGKDVARIDALFRRSGLMREKWNREDYRQGVLDRATADTIEVWSGASGSGSSKEERETGNSQQSWAPPVLFGQTTLPVFPADALPEPFRSFVSAEAVATQTPMDLSGMLVLSAISIACARKVVVEVRTGYREPVNIYTVTALPSGNRKTAVFSAVTAPITEYEDAETRRSAGAIAKAASARKIKEAKLRRLQEAAAQIGKDSAGAEQAALELAAEIASSELPEAPSIVTDDCTPEKLASLLAKNGGRIAVMSPEGDVFDLMAGRYSKTGTPNFAVLLKGHAGDTIRVNRMGRPPEHVQHPAITVGLAVQPEVIRGLASNPQFRGKGLLARFLYSSPTSLLGSRIIGAPPVPGSVHEDYRAQLLALLNLQSAADEDGRPVPYVLRLSAGASEALTAFEEWVEPQLAEFGVLGSICDWGGKLVGAVARIAGLLHMAGRECTNKPWDIPVSQSTMAMAIQIGEYLIPHARAAFAEMGADPVVEKAKKILRWIEHKNCSSFSRRDVHQGLRSCFKKACEIDPCLKVLVELGFIRPAPISATVSGRPASPVYDINPLWKRSDNPGPTADDNTSEYFEYSESPSGTSAHSSEALN